MNIDGRKLLSMHSTPFHTVCRNSRYAEYQDDEAVVPFGRTPAESQG
jgi:hypothetical protein